MKKRIVKWAVAASVVILALSALFFSARQSEANGYGYGYGGYGYNYGFSYYPTIPVYGSYSYYPTYYYPSYYTPTYYAPSYNYAPSYQSSTNYYDGNYHYHVAGNDLGQYWPAGNYAWRGGTWVAQSGYVETVPQYAQGWKTKVLDVASKRDDYNAYLNALKELGMPQPPPAQQGGQQPGMFAPANAMNGNANLGTYGANASTLYGYPYQGTLYTYSSVKDLYGDANINTLFQQAAQLAQNAQALGGEATKQFQSSVALEGGNRARVAEILARSQAAAETLRAAQGSESHTTTQGQTFRIEPQQPQPQVQPPQQGGAQPRVEGGGGTNFAAFVQLATAKCLRCHGGEKTEGKFDIRQYANIPVRDKVEKVWPRLTTTDKDKIMPKGGAPLTTEELKLFFAN